MHAGKLHGVNVMNKAPLLTKHHHLHKGHSLGAENQASMPSGKLSWLPVFGLRAVEATGCFFGKQGSIALLGKSFEHD
jgi:hypothetical protein